MKLPMELFEDIEGFEWDKGNLNKNWIRHQVLNTEAEQIFFNEPLIVMDDEQHTHREQRFHALGRTDANRYLFVTFTIRKKLIRIISARVMSRKERKTYHEKT